jgi:phosphohistidine phosphatase
MKLYFMRHGIAAARAEKGVGSDDRQRTLTAKGIKRTRKAAAGLVTLSVPFDRIVTSPLERARQTAQIVAEALKMQNRLEEIEELAPDRSVQELLRGLRSETRLEHILLVGHEPLLSATVSFLLCGSERAEIRIKKCGLCCLEVDGIPPKASAILHWALTPKQLRLLAQ